ncbi:Na(+)/citrate cotransporter isoform X6 [Panulirus ornatus]|uniref:Na(+)/citrate cotransporter isoform X6 n=1 Tax=Panulirus ornatus TaxID=150431 RepID=UPI003A89CBDF
MSTDVVCDGRDDQKRKTNRKGMKWLEFYTRHWKPTWRTLLACVAPVVFLPMIVIHSHPAARCGYVIMVMAIYWVTEALPLPVTALIPVFAFPLLGILSTGDVCIVYMKETNMMFLGGLTVAVAVEHCNLHKRIALKVILLVGQSPRMLMVGFMITTMFLSMWISNTATTAMMVPIVDAILAEMYETQTGEESQPENLQQDMRVSPANQSQMELVPPRDEEAGAGVVKNGRMELELVTKNPENPKQKPDEHKGLTSIPPNESCRILRDMCFLAVAYSANLGGTGSLTGTGPNLVVKAVLASAYTEPSGLNFLTWMMFNVPGMLICVFLAWAWLQILFLGLFRKKRMIAEVSPERKRAVKQLVEAKYKELGNITFQEMEVLLLFFALVLLWLFRAPEFIPGWASWFEETYHVEVDDATPAMLIVFLLFLLPAKLDFWCFWSPSNPVRDEKDKNSCLDWDVVQRKIPWGIVLLLGGGFAMAAGAKESGLSKWLGEQLYIFNGTHIVWIVLSVTLMTALLTEVASNTATASILLPVLNELALNMKVNPLYLMLPATVSCSYAFMLPVATPPNAIVFGAAGMRSSEMVRAGVIMNIICVIVINFMIHVYGPLIFELGTMPSWTNSTSETN